MGLLDKLRPSADEPITLRDDLSAGVNVMLHFVFLGALA